MASRFIRGEAARFSTEARRSERQCLGDAAKVEGEEASAGEAEEGEEGRCASGDEGEEEAAKVATDRPPGAPPAGVDVVEEGEEGGMTPLAEGEAGEEGEGEEGEGMSLRIL